VDKKYSKLLEKYGFALDSIQKQNVIIIADPGKDLDDEFTFVLASILHKMGVINLLGVVANLNPSIERAKLTKGTFNELGLPNIRVGYGFDMIDEGKAKYETDVPYLLDENIEEGQELLVDLLENNSSINLILQSGMTDANKLLKNNENLFLKKVKEVFIMGGAIIKNNKIEIDDAANLTFDKYASKEFLIFLIFECFFHFYLLKNKCIFQTFFLYINCSYSLFLKE